MSVQLKKIIGPAVETPWRRARPEPQDASGVVYRQILDAVLEQRLPPGTKLGEEQLADIFKVSRPVVRRALVQLSFERVLEIKPNRGAFIANPSIEEAHQVFDARRAIEESVTRACAKSCKRKDIAALRQHVRAELDVAKRDDRIRWIRLTGEFHLELARAAGNMLLVAFLEELVAQTSLIISLYGNGVRSPCGESDHIEILEAIAAGDEKAAVAKMIQHLQACEDSLIMDVDKDPRDLSEMLTGVPAARSPRKS